MSKSTGTPLGDDFPGVKALRAAKITTVEQVDDVEDLTKVPGITQPIAIKIGDYMDTLAADAPITPGTNEAPGLDDDDDQGLLGEGLKDTAPVAAPAPPVSPRRSGRRQPVARPVAPPIPQGEGLPEDFPFREELHAAGMFTLAAVKAVGDLTTLGIPIAYVSMVRKAAGYR